MIVLVGSGWCFSVTQLMCIFVQCGARALRKIIAVSPCPTMEDDKKPQRYAYAGDLGPRKSKFNIIEALGSVEAVRKYSAYLSEHARRLRQLQKEAKGEMSPSDEWYRDE